MENFEYYKSLAEKIFFKGINAKDIENFVKYREGNSFPNLEKAFFQGIVDRIGTYEKGIDFIAKRIYLVLEIDIKSFDRLYGKPDYDI